MTNPYSQGMDDGIFDGNKVQVSYMTDCQSRSRV